MHWNERMPFYISLISNLFNFILNSIPFQKNSNCENGYMRNNYVRSKFGKFYVKLYYELCKFVLCVCARARACTYEILYAIYCICSAVISEEYECSCQHLYSAEIWNSLIMTTTNAKLKWLLLCILGVHINIWICICL